MTFAYPQVFWLMLVAVPAVGLFLAWAWKTRQALMRQFVMSRLLSQLTVGVSPRRQKARYALLVSAVALLFFALAGPRYGFEWEEARQRGLDIVVAIDTSRSMLATDLAPNRLERSKLEALDLLKLARNDRLGLVAFAGTSFLQCPLTLDEDAFRQSVQALDAGIIPQGGTDVSGAIRTALSAFKDEKENHKILVVFTDGEDHEQGAVEAAREAAKAGLKVFTVGVGTAAGELIRVQDEKGAQEFLKDDSGNVVKSKLNERLLQEVATVANGFYLPLRGTKTMATLYEQGLAPLPKSESDSKLFKKYYERYAWPLGLAIVLLIIEMFIPDRKQPATTTAALPASMAPNLKGIVSVGLLLLGLAMPSARASTAQAKRDFEAGKYQEAAKQFGRLAKTKPDDPKLRFNAGTSALASGDLQEALTHLEASLSTPDLEMQQRAYYNLGHAHFRGGEQEQDPQEKLKHWESSLSRFESATKLNPSDGDASHNLEYVKRQIEELKKQMEKKPSDQKDPRDKDDKKDESKDESDPSKKEKSDKNDSKDGSNKEEKQQPNGDESKDDQKKNDQGQQDQKDQQGQQDQKDQKEGKDGSQSQKDESKSDPSGQKAQESKAGEQGQPQQPAGTISQMTPEQAAKILDAQKGEERAMLFVPPKNSKQRVRLLKDW